MRGRIIGRAPPEERLRCCERHLWRRKAGWPLERTPALAEAR